MAAKYDEIGVGYAQRRRTDPRIEAQVHAALGDARSVVNVGAGAGSYEPRDRWVLAVEPSAVMRAQRPPEAVPAIAGRAESLPLDDDSVDAAMACITIHHWEDRSGGLRELKRVARRRVVLLTYEVEAWLKLSWFVAEYAPEIAEAEFKAFGPFAETLDVLREGGTDVRVEVVPIPADCQDGFIEAWFGRPEALLEESVRRAQSVWSRLTDGAEERVVESLRRDLEDGTWDARHGELRTQPTFDGGLRIVVAELA